MNRVRKIVHADEVFVRGITGKGVTAAVLDSGICRHPDYIDRIIYFQDFVEKRQEFYDDASHGSHVTGILAGNGMMSMGKYRGIAPDCDVVHLKVLDQYGIGKLQEVIAGMEWILLNYRKYNIKIVNISVGTAGTGREEDEILLLHWVEKIWDAGLVVVVAAGNMGPQNGTVTIPGTSPKVITVGAYDDVIRSGVRMRPFYSGRGPTKTCICKPEITAPGFQITSCGSIPAEGKYYCMKSGTSMATPVVSGALALLLSVWPGITNLETKMWLKDTAQNLGLPKQQQGWGRLDLLPLLK